MKKYTLFLTFSLLILLVLAGTIYSQPRDASWQTIEKNIQDEKYNYAVSLLEDYITANPDSTKAYIMMGRLHLMLGRAHNLTMAKIVFDAGMERFRTKVSFYVQIASLYSRYDYYFEAMEVLQKALDAGFTDERVVSGLLEYCIYERDMESLLTLKAALEKVMSGDSVPSLFYAALSEIAIEMNDFQKAVRILKKGLENGMDDASYYRLLSLARFWSMQGAAFTETYYSWLAAEQDPLILAREYELAKWSMEKEDALLFEGIPYDEKSEFLIKYWRINDGYPITIQNERLIEFYRRRIYAETFYHSYSAPLGFNETGKFIIRRGLVGKNGQMQDEKNLIAVEFSPGREYHYVNYFQDIEKSMNFYPLLRYDDKTYLQYKQYFPDGLSLKIDMNVEPLFEFKLHIPELKFITQICQFRGGQGKTKIETAYGINMKELADRQFPYTNLQPSFTFETDLVVFDSLSVNHVRRRGSRKFTPEPDADVLSLKYMNSEECEVGPGGYKLAFQLIDLSHVKGNFPAVDSRNVKGGYIVKNLPVRDFSGSHLMISDLQFCRNIELKDYKRGGEIGELKKEPYPFKSLNKKNPVFLYFEIYNLFLVPAGTSDYRVTLSVGKNRSDGSFFIRPFRAISSIFSKQYDRTIETDYKREANAADSREFIELDLSGLPGGRTVLTVAARDLRRNVLVKRNIEFELMD